MQRKGLVFVNLRNAGHLKIGPLSHLDLVAGELARVVGVDGVEKAPCSRTEWTPYPQFRILHLYLRVPSPLFADMRKDFRYNVL